MATWSEKKKNSNPKVNCTLQGQLRKKVTATKASDLFFSLKIWGKFPQKIAKLVKFTLEKKNFPVFIPKKKGPNLESGIYFGCKNVAKMRKRKGKHNNNIPVFSEKNH
jgi:hypothetical protein